MGPLLADEAPIVFPGLVGPLLVATVVATVLWLVLLLVAAFATRPRDVDPAPATMELGEESPAVVDLLTNDWRVTPDAIPATLLDLAARGFVDLDQHGQGRTVCRVRRTAAGGLESYERMVFDHVAGLAVDGVVPAEALTTGPQDASARWWRAFQRAVVEDARARGLTRDRWSRPVERLLRVAALVPAGLAVLLANAAMGLNFGTVAAGIVLWVVLTGLVKRFRDQRDTPTWAATRCSRPCRPRRWPSGTGTWPMVPRSGSPRRRFVACRWGPRTTIGPGRRLGGAGGWSGSGTRGCGWRGGGRRWSRCWSALRWPVPAMGCCG
jgi:hypothetical protein